VRGFQQGIRGRERGVGEYSILFPYNNPHPTPKLNYIQQRVGGVNPLCNLLKPTE